MSAFERFSSKSTHAQAVETKDGGWKTKVYGADKKRYYRLSCTIKATGVVGMAVAALFPVAPLVAVGTYGAIAYIAAAVTQARIRTEVETGALIAPIGKILKNTPRYLIQPC